jgi:hypothetical protein
MTPTTSEAWITSTRDRRQPIRPASSNESGRSSAWTGWQHYSIRPIGFPVRNVRFGLDALIGLFPGVGDVASAALSAYLIYQARRLGVRRSAIARMIGNVALDMAVGALPLVGDAADVFWRANARNMRILRAHFGGRDRR